MKSGLHDRLRATQRDLMASDTGPMKGSINNQQPSTIRGEAQGALRAGFLGRDKVRLSMSRPEIAAFLVCQLTDDTCHHPAPAISN